MTRILHFSDVHVPGRFGGVRPTSFLNKRIAGIGNYTLRRRPRYADGPDKLRSLAGRIADWNVDVALCTGDYTIVGTDPELRFARECVQPIIDAAPQFVTIPGNHDVYLQDSVGIFEQHFGDQLRTEMPEHAVDRFWPMVRLFGDHAAIVCINSVRPNPSILRSSGLIPQTQIDALGKILVALEKRFVIIATHYAPRLASGEPDSRRHGLVNANALLEATRGFRGAIVHGHVHHNYSVRVPETSMTLCGAGSTTMKDREGLWLYEITADKATATPGTWRDGYVLLEDQRIDL